MAIRGGRDFDSKKYRKTRLPAKHWGKRRNKIIQIISVRSISVFKKELRAIGCWFGLYYRWRITGGDVFFIFIPLHSPDRGS